MKPSTKPSKETLENWHRDPNNWKWGVFYYNTEDPRLMPPKRIPAMGYTVNFGNKKSVLFFIMLIVVPSAIIYLSIYFLGK